MLFVFNFANFATFVQFHLKNPKPQNLPKISKILNILRQIVSSTFIWVKVFIAQFNTISFLTTCICVFVDVAVDVSSSTQCDSKTLVIFLRLLRLHSGEIAEIYSHSNFAQKFRKIKAVTTKFHCKLAVFTKFFCSKSKFPVFSHCGQQPRASRFTNLDFE